MGLEYKSQDRSQWKLWSRYSVLTWFIDFLMFSFIIFWSLICCFSDLWFADFWFSDLWFSDPWFDLFDLVGVLWKQSPSGFEMYPEGTSLAFRLMNYLYFVWHTTYVLGHHHHRMTTSSSALFFYLIRATIITIIKLFIVSKLKNT